MWLNDFIKNHLDRRLLNNNYRSLSINKYKYDFYSNDYLGFAKNNDIKKLTEDILKDYSISQNGSTGSRLISGNNKLIEDVENYISKFHNAEAGLIFNSGYSANIGLLSALGQRNNCIIYDELIHASIKDALRLSFSKFLSFKHNNTSDLEIKLKKTTGNKIVIIEGIYSMDGDEPPLNEIYEICKNNDTLLIIDEAHSTGTIGKKGIGLVATKLKNTNNIIRIHTFGKAIGVCGAIVLGSNMLRNYLVNYARTFIYTTALPPYVIANIYAAYITLEKSDRLIDKLNDNISLFKSIIKQQNNSNSPIQPIFFDNHNKMIAISKKLQSEGFAIQPIMPPTVPPSKERIRITIHSFNNHDEISLLCNYLNNFN